MQLKEINGKEKYKDLLYLNKTNLERLKGSLQFYEIFKDEIEQKIENRIFLEEGRRKNKVN